MVLIKRDAGLCMPPRAAREIWCRAESCPNLGVLVCRQAAFGQRTVSTEPLVYGVVSVCHHLFRLVPQRDACWLGGLSISFFAVHSSKQFAVLERGRQQPTSGQLINAAGAQACPLQILGRRPCEGEKSS